MSDSIGEVLQSDEDVDQLSEFQVIDTYARGQFMYQIIQANGPSYMRSDDCDHVQELLSEGSGSAVMEASCKGLGTDHDVTQSLGWEDGEGNVRTLFSILLNDGYDRDELIDYARSRIKETLRGSGMPRINVMKARLKKHMEGDK